jgi:hypothetical protein
MKMQPLLVVCLLLVAATAGAQTTNQTMPNTAGTPTITTPNTQIRPNTSNTATSTTTTPTAKTPSKNPKAAAPAAGGGRTDFALFDGTDANAPEAGVECGAVLGSSKNSVGFTFHVTVSNWSDALKVLRVVYADGEEVARYQIPAHTSFAFTQAGGGTPGVDDLITVVAEGSLPSGLAGSMSISVPAAAKPHPTIGEDFCTTVATQPTLTSQPTISNTTTSTNTTSTTKPTVR